MKFLCTRVILPSLPSPLLWSKKKSKLCRKSECWKKNVNKKKQFSIKCIKRAPSYCVILEVKPLPDWMTQAAVSCPQMATRGRQRGIPSIQVCLSSEPHLSSLLLLNSIALLPKSPWASKRACVVPKQVHDPLIHTLPRCYDETDITDEPDNNPTLLVDPPPWPIP